MTKKEVKGLSKFLSLVLRHKPGIIQLTLDEQGWATIEELLEKSQQHGKSLTLEILHEIVATNDKKRFAFSDDGHKIRASQGHSISIKLDYEPTQPPVKLFHGTATRFLDSILEKGILKGNRHHVHLSANETTAQSVGQRHGKPVILQVNARAMHAAGYQFFVSENGVWLTEYVPIEFLKTS